MTLTTTAPQPPATTETTQPRFTIFQGVEIPWVLRDHVARKDYPFLTKPAAIGGMELRLSHEADYIGSPAHKDVYGAPILEVEVFA